MVGGRAVQAMGDDELSNFRARHLGFVFQSFNLLPVLPVVPVLTAYEHIEPYSSASARLRPSGAPGSKGWATLWARPPTHASGPVSSARSCRRRQGGPGTRQDRVSTGI